jgi:two-component sensor histidine kinase
MTIEWTKSAGEGGDYLDLLWSEIDGPTAPSIKRRGFGLKLIERETSYNLGGKASVDFEPGGIQVGLTFPLDGK